MLQKLELPCPVETTICKWSFQEYETNKQNHSYGQVHN